MKDWNRLFCAASLFVCILTLIAILMIMTEIKDRQEKFFSFIENLNYEVVTTSYGDAP